VSIFALEPRSVFAGSDAGSEHDAIVYAILPCCRLADALPCLACRGRLRVIGVLMPAR
jgi:hypothetical protein